MFSLIVSPSSSTMASYWLNPRNTNFLVLLLKHWSSLGETFLTRTWDGRGSSGSHWFPWDLWPARSERTELFPLVFPFFFFNSVLEYIQLSSQDIFLQENRIFPPLQRSPINNFIVKGLGRIHKGAQSFPSSRRAEVPRPPTPPPGHLPLLSFSNVTRWRFQLLYGASPSGQPGGEWGHRAQHKKWSWSRSLLSKTREKLQAASSSAAHPPRGPSLPQHHAGKSSGGLSP